MIEKRSRWMARAALGVFVIMTTLFAAQSWAFLKGSAPHAAWAALLLPKPFYLYAMGATWWWLRRIGEGERFGVSLARLMRRAGLALFLGGLIEVFGTNVVTSLTVGRALYPINETAIVIGVVGVGLYGLAGLIDEARQVKTELEEFV
ncbi:hypothetical protein [Sphingomicrobium nitratireducens]|uniref:hypothetical protein n=1 Tax=Sphingomicrobium nitratireducens TaxID=2964666 RepID=UPI00223F89A9|nr:hypothetical protein [Sphingomicrobium nitratireducens]